MPKGYKEQHNEILVAESCMQDAQVCANNIINHLCPAMYK